MIARCIIAALLLVLMLSPVGLMLAYVVAEANQRALNPWDVLICSLMTFCWLPNRVINRAVDWMGA